MANTHNAHYFLLTASVLLVVSVLGASVVSVPVAITVFSSAAVSFVLAAALALQQHTPGHTQQAAIITYFSSSCLSSSFSDVS